MPNVNTALNKLFENTLEILPYPAFIYHAGRDVICAMNHESRQMDGQGFDFKKLIKCHNEYSFVWHSNKYIIQKRRLDSSYCLFECRPTDPEITKLKVCVSRLDRALTQIS